MGYEQLATSLPHGTPIGGFRSGEQSFADARVNGKVAPTAVALSEFKAKAPAAADCTVCLLYAGSRRFSRCEQWFFRPTITIRAGCPSRDPSDQSIWAAIIETALAGQLKS